MGHEFSGTLTEVADAVEGFSLGDRVVVYPFSACGECPNCSRGDDHVCQQAAVTGLGLGTNPGAAARGGVSRKLVRSRGIVVLLGVLEEPVEISQLVLMIKETEVRASFAYRREEFEEAVELIAAGDCPLTV
jgi:(R,R)-butanediol dehydrogenase/meso-butanediol dehydrogenase/diacetyl reductase